jgi:glucose-6-phosphate isomerase
LAWGSNDPDHPTVPIRLKDNTGEAAETATNDNNNSSSNTHHHQSTRRRYQTPHSKVHVEPVCRIPSYHLSLRAPAGHGLEMLDANGTNVLPAIHSDWDRIRRISEAIRLGKLAGVTGQMIQDVVVVGRGTPLLALRFVYLALCKDQLATIGRRAGLDRSSRQRRIKFLTSVDPVRAAACVADSNPATTLVVSIALAGDEEETNMATQALLQNWLLAHLGGHGRQPEHIFSKHVMYVTGNETVATRLKPESTFVLPSHSRREPFTTFTAAGLLPLSIVFGWHIVEHFLAGAHDMDSHFVETNPRHNLPVLLALTDIWNDCLACCENDNTITSRSAGRIVTPFTEAFAAYPAFVAEIEAQTCGRRTSSGSTGFSCSSTVIDGGLHGVYDRSLYQSSNILPSELVMTLDSQLAANADPKSSSSKGGGSGGGSMEGVYQAQDALICSLFAHADELAFGSSDYLSTGASFPNGKSTSPRTDFVKAPYHLFADDGHQAKCTGNRPSTLLLCGKLDAFTCGQLVALAEHRAVIKAWIWQIDPFPRDVGTSLRGKRTQNLRHRLAKWMVQGHDDEDSDDHETEEGGGSSDMNLSTKTILQHYANLYRHERVYTVNSNSG